MSELDELKIKIEKLTKENSKLLSIVARMSEEIVSLYEDFVSDNDLSKEERDILLRRFL